MRFQSVCALVACLVCSTAARAATEAAITAAAGTEDMKHQISSTVSPEGRRWLQGMYAMQAKAPMPPRVAPATVEDWDKLNASYEAAIGPLVTNFIAKLQVSLKDDVVGGVHVVRFTPPAYKPRPSVLLYAHGGGYVLFSARSETIVPALMAVATGDEVISIDYTLAPRGNWRTVTDQVLAVYRATLTRYRAADIGMFGDSAGGGLIAGATLKMRDQGLPLPAALCLLSPWSDITATGDTYSTLAAADPSLNAVELKWGADVYAPESDQKNPYVSPVYGDYAKPFPPTLIQGGTREIFLSNFVRQYQAIRSGGNEAVLDLYEGMPHVFQAIAPTIPETTTAMKRAADFFKAHLDVSASPHSTR